MAETILRMKGIRKRFPGVQALDGVSFDLQAGEVHVLIGENGAGKSTLMKILSGIYPKDEGSIFLAENEVTIGSPRDAIRQGVVMIHQELAPIPEMTIAENIFVGREPARLGVVQAKKLNENAAELLQRLECNLDPAALMRTLSVAHMQMVEISKALSFEPRVIIMDEPTSAIGEDDVDHLFSVIRKLKEQGVGIVYISHKLNEIYRISDRITVLRDGRNVVTKKTSEVDRNELISLMVGREIHSIFPKRSVPIGGEVLRVEGLGCEGVFHDIGFTVRSGEILGISGLMGAGRTEVVEAVCGIRKLTTGTVWIEGKVKTIRSPKDAIREGLAIVTEDRKRTGLNLKGTVKENMTLLKLRELSRFGVMQSRAERALVDEKIAQLQVKTPGRDHLTISLSGGNQQKVVIAKWLLVNPKVLILDEPTRGIDVGAKSEIHRLIVDFAEKGMAVIMISSELPEIIGMSDRVFVMHEGQGMGCLDRSDFTQERIMKLSTGHYEDTPNEQR